MRVEGVAVASGPNSSMIGLLLCFTLMSYAVWPSLFLISKEMSDDKVTNPYT